MVTSENTGEGSDSALALIFFKSSGGHRGACLSLGLPLSPRSKEESPRLTWAGGSKMGQSPDWERGTVRSPGTGCLLPLLVSWSRHGVQLGEKVLLLSHQVRGGCPPPLGKAYTHTAMCACVKTTHVHTHPCVHATTRPRSTWREARAVLCSPLCSRCCNSERCIENASRTSACR